MRAPLALADAAVAIPGKRGLAVLNGYPLNAEIPVHLLDDNITPAKYLFVCNNGTRLLAAAPRTGRS